MEQDYTIDQQSGSNPQVVGPQPPPPLYRQKMTKEKSLLRQYIETVVLALLAAILLRMFVVSAYRVSSGSMEDTLLEGDYIFVNKLAYHSAPPKAGDIIVFENPFDASRDYIKRIVATEGQTVEIVDKVVYIDSKVAPIPQASKNSDPKIFPGVLSVRDNFGPLMVPAGQVFVMGDNRDNSQDSRYWGCVDKSYIKGKAIFIYFSYVPDPKAPEWKAPYIFEFFEIFFYNLFHFPDRLRLEQVGRIL
jgi:signal peptidase I